MFDQANFPSVSIILLSLVKTIQQRPIVLVLLGSAMIGFAAVILGAYYLWQMRLQAEVTDQLLVQASAEHQVVVDEEPADQTIRVYVSGEVKKPGVYTLKDGDRVGQAVDAAGGFSKQASKSYVLQQLNLARAVVDGEQVHVPAYDETSEQANSQPSVTVVAEKSGLISINAATAKELETLIGIGEKRAEDIISSRPHTTIDELVTKGVISQTVFDEIKTEITL